MFSKNSRIVILLLAILLVAGIFRFYDLTRADVINDEVLIAFRSVGYIDFFYSPDQPTPWEWLESVPGWAKVSFHDHPPVVFALQYLSFFTFGVNVFALRLPFALAGVLCVFLTYLIAKRLFDEKTGLLAGLILAVSTYHIWISRIGLQESVLIFFILLAFYLFIKNLQDGRHWQWGVAFGLAMLTKYTAVFLVPAFFTYLIIFNKEVFQDKRFWLGSLTSLIIFSPVIFYNIKLYQNFGHFDLQFSYLFGQEVAAWQSLPGKEQIGSLAERFAGFIPNLKNNLLWPLFSLFTISFFYAAYRVLRIRDEEKKSLSLILITLFFIISLLLFVIGPSQRFMTLLLPFMAMLIAYAIMKVKVKHLKTGLVIILVATESFLAYNTLLAATPYGQKAVTYSELRSESYNWGFNQLNSYVENIVKNKKPALTFPTRYGFLEEIKAEALEKAREAGKEEAAILMIYDQRIFTMGTFWSFHRQLVYSGWPIITNDLFLQQGADFWREQGITDFYYFEALPELSLYVSNKKAVDDAAAMQEVVSEDPPIDKIKNSRGTEVFNVYHFD